MCCTRMLLLGVALDGVCGVRRIMLLCWQFWSNIADTTVTNNSVIIVNSMPNNQFLFYHHCLLLYVIIHHLALWNCICTVQVVHKRCSFCVQDGNDRWNVRWRGEETLSTWWVFALVVVKITDRSTGLFRGEIRDKMRPIGVASPAITQQSSWGVSMGEVIVNGRHLEPS